MDIKGKRILIAQTAYFGDVVLTWHLVWRAHILSGQRVGLLARPQFDSLFSASQDVVEFLPFDKHKKDRGIGGLARVAKSLRSRFDIALSPHPSFRTALVLALSKIPIRVGFDSAQGSFLYNVKAFWDERKHEIERQMALFEALGVCADGISVPPIPFLDDQRLKADALLVDAGISPNDMLVGINPFSVWNTKRWLLEYWAELAEMIEQGLDAKVVVVGGAGDLADSDRLLRMSKARLVSLVGKTDFGVLNALVKRFRLFISNDSGPAHISAMQGVPTIVIFGSTTPSLGYAPRGKHVDVVEVSLECRPCGRHGYMKCPKGHFRCMQDITPEMVLEKVRSMFVELVGK